ncbi:MAG: hypothetical protein PHS79_01865 [Patescibacteria group bacterium]|nr:hypothetical protein [Patescibacteria group bacterium]
MSAKIDSVDVAKSNEIVVPPNLELTNAEKLDGWEIAFRDGHAYKFLPDYYRRARLVAVV